MAGHVGLVREPFDGRPTGDLGVAWRCVLPAGGLASCGPRLALRPPGPHQSPDVIPRNRHNVTLLRSWPPRCCIVAV